MTKDDIDDWLNDPVTQYVFNYWSDIAAAEVEGLKDQIIAGSILTPLEQAQRSAINMALTEVREVSFEEIDSFYNGDNEDEGTRK
jgi:hypothetical protein